LKIAAKPLQVETWLLLRAYRKSPALMMFYISWWWSVRKPHHRPDSDHAKC